MLQEDVNKLEDLLQKIKDDTEDYASFETMARRSEKYMLILAIERYLEVYN